MMFGRFRTLAVVACAFGVLFAGCGGSGGTSSAVKPTMLFINASADTTALDLWLNETILASNFQYLEANADFTPFEFISDDDGAYDVVTQDTNTEEVFDSQNRVFELDTDTIIVSVGLQNFGTEFLKRLQSVFINVNRTAPNGNKARLYVVHALVREAGFTTPQVIFQNPGDNPQFSTGGIDYGSAKDITVDSGPSDWEARRQDADGDVIYATQSTTLDPGSVYLVMVSGIENDADPNKQPKITFIKLTTE